MASNTFTVQVNGLQKLLSKINNVNKVLAEDVSNELSQGAINIASQAALLAPKGRTGELAGSIGYDISKPHTKTVFVRAIYGAYVEFGTGLFVFKSASGFNFTPEMRAFAMEFFVSGEGRMHAHPFLFPALQAEIPQTLNRVERKVRKAIAI